MPRLAEAHGEKRQAEQPVDDLREIVGQHADDDIQIAPSPVTPGGGAGRDSTTSADTGGSSSSSSAPMSSLKWSMYSDVEEAVKDDFRQTEQDISEKEVESIAAEVLALTSVAEVYSPPRFAKLAPAFGLQPGFSADLEVLKANGEPWDLTNEDDQKLLEYLQETEDPFLLTESPPCEAFSAILRIMSGKRNEEQVAQKKEQGLQHLRIAVEAYRIQMKR